MEDKEWKVEKRIGIKSRFSDLHHPSSIFHVRWSVFCLVLSVLLLAVRVTPALAHDPTGGHPSDDELLNAVAFDQKLDAQVPLDVTFRDEVGQPVKLGDYFGQKPVILMFAYYECPNLCTLALNGLRDSLENLKFSIGEEFQVVTIGIDPDETANIAAAKKVGYIARYGREGAAAGWHFLTGEHAAIDRVADAVGFHYAYDPESDQYAHATGIMILTPQGRISKYFYGVEYSPRDLRFGLVEASTNKIGSPVDQLLLRCFRYDPTRGKYTVVIMNVLKVAGIATALMLGGFIFLMVRFDPNRT